MPGGRDPSKPLQGPEAASAVRADRAWEEEARRRPKGMPQRWEAARGVKLGFARLIRVSERWGKKQDRAFEQHQMRALRHTLALEQPSEEASLVAMASQPRRSAASTHGPGVLWPRASYKPLGIAGTLGPAGRHGPGAPLCGRRYLLEASSNSRQVVGRPSAAVGVARVAAVWSASHPLERACSAVPDTWTRPQKRQRHREVVQDGAQHVASPWPMAVPTLPAL